MRYLFSTVVILTTWMAVLAIAASSTLHTRDRFVLYICLIILTAGLYKIGFSKK